MYVRIAIVVSVAVGAFYVGSGLTERDYESRLHQQAVDAAESWNAALEAANRAAEAQRKQDVADATKRAQRSAAAKGVTHEIHVAGPGADWTPDERVRLERLYAAHGFAPDGAPLGVQDRLPVASESRDAPE